MWMMERSPGCCQGSGSIQTGSGTSGDTGLLGMGTPGHSHIHQGRAQSYSPSQQLAGMPAWAHTGYPHTTLRCSAPRGAAFLWQKAGLSPRTKDPQPQPGWGRGPMGSAPASRFSSHPRRVSLQGGGRLLWHNLLALLLSAWGRNEVPCSTVAMPSWQGKAQPRSHHIDGNHLPGARAGRAMLTLPSKGRPAHHQRGKPCACGVGDRICPSVRSPERTGPALPPTPRPVYPAHPWAGRVLFPPQRSAGLCQPGTGRVCWGAALLQAARAEALCRTVGRCVGHCKVLRNRGSDYVQDSLDQDVTPPRGMAAAQPLTATRHDSFGQDVDESAVRAVSAAQGGGCLGPVLNSSMAWGYHAPGADTWQDSSELAVVRRLNWRGLCRLRMAISFRAWLRGAGLI